jgi:hypothetical protein
MQPIQLTDCRASIASNVRTQYRAAFREMAASPYGWCLWRKLGTNQFMVRNCEPAPDIGWHVVVKGVHAMTEDTLAQRLHNLLVG